MVMAKGINPRKDEAESTCMKDERKNGDEIMSKIYTQKRSERYHTGNPGKSGEDAEHEHGNN
jgi:hypothetical protein